MPQGAADCSKDQGRLGLRGRERGLPTTCSTPASTSASSAARPASTTSTRRRRSRRARTCSCEKPFTIEPADAWDLVETAERTGRHLLVAYGWNYLPMVQRGEAADGRARDRRGRARRRSSMASVTRELLSNRGAYPDAAPECVPDQATWTEPATPAAATARRSSRTRSALALWLTGLRGEEVFALMTAPSTRRSSSTTRSRSATTNGAIGTMSGASSHLGAARQPPRSSRSARSARTGELHARPRARTPVALPRTDGDDVRAHARAGRRTLRLRRPADRRSSTSPSASDVVNCSPGELGARTVEILDAALSQRHQRPDRTRQTLTASTPRARAKTGISTSSRPRASALWWVAPDSIQLVAT